VPVRVIGVRVEISSNNPIVLLGEAHGDRYLPIWIGAVEATAIAFALQGMVSQKPLTHDLFRDVLQRLDVQLLNVTISGLIDGIFESYLSLSGGHGTVTCRPSDGIALAVRTGAPVLVNAELLDTAGVALPDNDAHLPGLLLR
jgi:bifunctional DNase/RNase